MAIASNSLTTRVRQKTFLEIRSSNTVYDSVLDVLIDSATSVIESYCDRTFKRTAYSSEEYDGTGTHDLLLDNYPVDTAQTFTLQERTTVTNEDDWDTVDAEDYFVKADEGIIHWTAQTFLKRVKAYRVSYTAGYYLPQDSGFSAGASDSLPGDLELACWLLVAKVFRRRRQGTGVSSVRSSDVQIVFQKELMLDKELRSILDQYRRID